MAIIGGLQRLTYTVVNASNVATTPSAIQLVITLPDGTTTGVLTPTLAGTGSYTYDYAPGVAGRHVATWISTGPATAASEIFNAGAADSGGIVSLADVLLHLNKTTVSAGDETELRRMIAGATRKIEHHCGPVVRRTITERHSGGGGVVFLRDIPGPSSQPFITLASVTPLAGGAGLNVALLDADPLSGAVAYLDGYTYFPCSPAGMWLWTYQAGRAVIDEDLQLAALNYVRGSWETQRGSGTGGNALGGQQDEITEAPGMGLVNWRLEQDLAPYRRMSGIA